MLQMMVPLRGWCTHGDRVVSQLMGRTSRDVHDKCRAVNRLHTSSFNRQQSGSVSDILEKDVHDKCRAVNRLHTSSFNRQQSGSVSDILENLFTDQSKARIIDRLKKAKPFVRPTKPELPRKAAVLVPLCKVDGEPSLLYMMRSLHLKNHAGEICFPGGMVDKGDDSMEDTALRETQEEIGLDPASVDVWGPAPPMPSRVQNGQMVHPIVGYCGEVDVKKLTLNESEVYSVFTRPLSSFLVAENQRQTQFRFPNSKGYTIPVFTGGEHSIWGLTAALTHQILTIMIPELYTFKLKLRH